eukprot:2561186-Pyramimonas_sp.AAC.1
MQGCDPRDLFGAPFLVPPHILALRGSNVADKQAAEITQLAHAIDPALRRGAAATVGAAAHDPDASDTALPDPEGVPAIAANDVDESIGVVFQRPRSAPT